MTNLVSIHKDVLVDILDKLSIPDLLNFLATNKALKDKHYPDFREKIKDYQDDLRYQKEVAIPKQITRFEKFAEDFAQHDHGRFIIIAKKLAQFVGVEHMCTYDQDTLYTASLLSIWWLTYFGDLINPQSIITIDDQVANLTGIAPGTRMTYDQFMDIIAGLFVIAQIAPDVPIPDEIMVEMTNELHELLDMDAFSRKKYKDFN